MATILEPTTTCHCDWNRYTLHDFLMKVETDAAALRELVSMVCTWGECSYSGEIPPPEDLEDFFLHHNWDDNPAMRDLGVCMRDLWNHWKDKTHYREQVEAARAILAPSSREEVPS